MTRPAVLAPTCPVCGAYEPCACECCGAPHADCDCVVVLHGGWDPETGSWYESVCSTHGRLA